MDFDNMTSFKALSGVEMNVPAVDGVKAMDANVTRHAADTEAGQLIVTIIEQECFNEMSGERFLHQVRVEVKGHADDGFSTFQGCGAYVPNFLLNDIWVLTHLNGEKVDDSKLAKGLPTLEFHLRDMQLRGHSGCNNLNAAISFPDREAIQFGPIAGTLMACPDSDIEDALLTALSEKRLRYQIENLRLTLSGPGGTVLVFKKVD
jgi:heat shock protein HslJ